MMLLRAYIDDSGSDGQGLAFVLAGFAAPASDWERFADDWRRELDRDPPIPVLKTSRAMALDGRFRAGWTKPLVEQRLLALAEVAAKHAKLRVGVALPNPAFHRFVRAATGIPEFRDPYFLCFYALVLRLARQLPIMFGEGVECEIVFDHHGDIGNRAMQWWYLVEELLDSKGRQIFIEPPQFRNDEKFLPLQAADLHAWLVNRAATGEEQPAIAKAIWRQWEQIPAVSQILTPEFLTELGAGLVVSSVRARRELRIA